MDVDAAETGLSTTVANVEGRNVKGGLVSDA